MYAFYCYVISILLFLYIYMFIFYLSFPVTGGSSAVEIGQ